MKKMTACLLLIFSIMFLDSCGKKEEAPKEEVKTESAKSIELQTPAPLSDVAPSMEADNEMKKMEEYASPARAAAPGAPATQTPTQDVPTLAFSMRADTNAPKDKQFIRTGELKFQVNNVHKATETIEDLTGRYSGFVTLSNLKNREERTSEHKFSKDTILITKQIIVESDIILRVPAEKLDSLVRELNQLLVFLDYRLLSREDVTLKFKANQMQKNRMVNYEKRQTKNIDTKRSTLETKTYAEENLLDKQMQTDNLDLRNMEMEDQVKYCTLTIHLYQAPLIATQKVYNFEYIEEMRPNFWERSWESIIHGWWGLESVIVGIITIWPLLILGIIGFVVYRRISKRTKSDVK